MSDFLQRAKLLGKEGVLRDPKLSPRSRKDRHGWFPYYAGFSPDFAHGVLSSELAAGAQTVLDPWNGAGTTTTEAQRLGYRAIGFDLSPVAVLVALAKLTQRQDAHYLEGLLDRILAVESSYGAKDGEPLLRWLHPDTAWVARAMVNKVLELLATTKSGAFVDPLFSPLPPLAAFLVLGIVRACRRLAGVETSSNPTWIRPVATFDSNATEFTGLVRQILDEMTADLGHSEVVNAEVAFANSRKMPLASSTVDLVVSSPPYCTRLDYVVHNSIELAVLGLEYRKAEYTKLRREMTGTPLARIRPLQPPNEAWGSGVCTLLRAIQEHPSSDSRSYYYKVFWQYFDDIWSSLTEIRRILRAGGGALLVAQSSYYKDIHIDLPCLLAKMATRAGLASSIVADFPVRKVMATMNTNARKYCANREYRESIVGFQV